MVLDAIVILDLTKALTEEWSKDVLKAVVNQVPFLRSSFSEISGNDDVGYKF